MWREKIWLQGIIDPPSYALEIVWFKTNALYFLHKTIFKEDHEIQLNKFTGKFTL